MRKEEKIRKFLQEKKLLKTIEDNLSIFGNVLKNCLKAEKETILIITDNGHKNKNIALALAYGYSLASKNLGLKFNFIIQKPKKRGDRADSKVIKSLQKLEKKNIIILTLSNRLGKISGLGKSFRRFARNQGHKYISSTSLSSIPNSKLAKLITALNPDYSELRKKCLKLKKILDKARKIHLTSPKGTDLCINVQGMTAIPNDGDYSLPEKGGNIPAGEVYIPAKGKSNVDGKAVIDVSAATREGTIKIKKPIILEIKKGSIVDIKGSKEAEILAKSLRWAENKAKHPEYISKISEVGFGLNENASLLGCTVIDEKSLGTAHIALGSNYWFGGSIYGIIHLDMVFSDPKIEVDGKEIDFL